MKRYLVFTFDEFYPGGGWSDFRGTFDTKEEALAALAGYVCDGWQIVDTQTMEVVDNQ